MVADGQGAPLGSAAERAFRLCEPNAVAIGERPTQERRYVFERRAERCATQATAALCAQEILRARQRFAFELCKISRAEARAGSGERDGECLVDQRAALSRAEPVAHGVVTHSSQNEPRKAQKSAASIALELSERDRSQRVSPD